MNSPASFACTAPAPRRAVIPTVSALVAACLLVACGGGTDPVAPAITAQPQAQSVREGAAASFTVNAASDAGAMSYAWGLEGGAAISGANSGTYRIETASLADHGKRFVATVRNDAGGTASAAAPLTVTERSWGTTVQPIASGTARPGMALAVDTSGTTHLAYTELLADQVTRLILASKGPLVNTPGSARGFGGWQQPAGTTHQQVRLVPGNAGVVLVLWREGIADDGGNVLRAALLYNEGNGFSDLGQLTEPGSNAANPEGVWVSPDTLEVAYRTHDGQRWRVATRRFTLNATRDGGQWAPAAAVETLDANLGPPQIASDGQGNVLVAFSTTGDTPRAYVNARPAAATAWQPTAAADVSDLDANTPAEVASLAMNRQGRGVLLTRSTLTRVYMRSYVFGGQTPGWQAGAAYVANRWENLGAEVQPALVFHNDGSDFSIISVHNNGRFISRWPCSAGGCGGLQTFVDVGATSSVHDLRAASDAAGNFIVAYTQAQPDGPLRPYAVRYHQGLNAWRPAAPIGQEPSVGQLELAMAADGRATLLFGTPTPGLTPRTADFR